MIIIKEQAEAKLLEAIAKSNAENEKPKAIQLLLPEVQKSDISLTQRVYAKIGEMLSGSACNIYLCDDGDIILYGEGVSIQVMQNVCELIETMYEIAPGDYLKAFYEKKVNWYEFTKLVQDKYKYRSIKDESEAKQILSEKRKQAREAALNQPIDNMLLEQVIKQRNVRPYTEILIVEDDPFSRTLVRNALKETYRVTSTENGFQAIEAYAKTAPDVMFLDIDLPDVSGHDILKKILSIDPDAYIIMLSGNGDRENVLKAIENGAKGFVAKPFTKDKLIAYIHRCPTVELTVA